MRLAPPTGFLIIDQAFLIYNASIPAIPKARKTTPAIEPLRYLLALELVGELEEDPEAVVFEAAVDTEVASVGVAVDSVEAEFDPVDAGAEELPVPLVMALELRVPPNGAFGLTLLSVFEAALLNESSESEPWLMTPTMPPWQCESTAQ